jgi:hypothetical protein
MNELLQGNTTIRSVGDDRTWNVTLKLDECNRNFAMRTGWKSFSQEHNLQVGDVCKFEMTQREPLSFTITIIPATKEPCPVQFQGISFFIIVFGKIYIYIYFIIKKFLFVNKLQSIICLNFLKV